MSGPKFPYAAALSPTAGAGASIFAMLMRIVAFSVAAGAAGKSGALLGLPIELVLLAAGLEGAVPDAKRAANAFAVGYQIADDLLDASQDQKQAGGGSALNILFVLQAAGPHGDARIEAKRIGLQHLQESSAAARLLPCDAGALFLKLAESMNSVLTMEPG